MAYKPKTCACKGKRYFVENYRHYLCKRSPPPAVAGLTLASFSAVRDRYSEDERLSYNEGNCHDAGCE